MKEVLVVIQLVRRGGVEIVAINFAKQLQSLKKYNISFLLINPNEHQDEELYSQLKADGFNIYEVDKSAKGYLGKFRFLNSFFKSHHFDVVHSHVIFFSGIVLSAAKLNGVKTRIAHSHIIKRNEAENVQYKLYKTIMRALINACANYKLACSIDAGFFLYGKKTYEKNGIFIPNGIDIKKYEFNPEYRNEIRNEFGIEENAVFIGHIGTIYRIKNQTFLLDIFNNILNELPDAKLIMVGEENEKESVIEKAERLGIYDRIIIAGPRADVYKMYQAFDIMVFPSLHEALPVSLIEAQASKLPCLISDTITREVIFNSNMDFFSLDEDAASWANKALSMLRENRENISIEKLRKTYDLKNVVNLLVEIYG